MGIKEIRWYCFGEVHVQKPLKLLQIRRIKRYELLVKARKEMDIWVQTDGDI